MGCCFSRQDLTGPIVEPIDPEKFQKMGEIVDQKNEEKRVAYEEKVQRLAQRHFGSIFSCTVSRLKQGQIKIQMPEKLPSLQMGPRGAAIYTAELNRLGNGLLTFHSELDPQNPRLYFYFVTVPRQILGEEGEP